MDKGKPDFPVGYGKPPHQTRFKPGRSGNPDGRPRKKADTFAEMLERELNTQITIHEGGKPRKVTKLHAIVKQQTIKAINGDFKAAALVMKAVEPRQFDPMDNLSPVLHEMRAIHAKHQVASQNATRVGSATEVTAKVDDDHD